MSSRKRNGYLSFEGKSMKTQYGTPYQVFPQDTGVMQREILSDDYKRHDIDQQIKSDYEASTQGQSPNSLPSSKIVESQYVKRVNYDQDASDRHREPVPVKAPHHNSFENLNSNAEMRIPTENPDYNKIMRAPNKKNTVTYYTM